MIDRGDLINEMYVIQNDIERLIKKLKTTEGCGHDRYDFEIAIEHFNKINSEIEDAIFILDFPDPDNECDCGKEITEEEENEYVEPLLEYKRNIRIIKSIEEA